MVFTFNPQAYLLLREREKAGVEPISKVLIFSTFAAESQFFITGSHWPCKAFGQSAFWRGVEGGGGGDQHLSDGQQTRGDGQLTDSLTIYSWHRPEPAFRMVSWCEVREAVSKRYSCRNIVGSEEYDFSDISRCDPSIARTLPYWRRTHWWRRGGMSSSSNAGKFSFLWKTFELWKMFISVLWIMACYSRLYIQFNLIIGHNSQKVFSLNIVFQD